ncbi:MAG: redoxin domain-containing protein [Acidobacteria bacterium]|nr:redoxin domain-containing protein [Acidobacteriota bacterium]
MSLQVGDTAPDFELGSHRGEKVRLSSFAGQKHVVVAFHPLAFTPVCATQMQNYEKDKSWFDEHETHVLGLSVDAVPAKIEWAKLLGGINFDLLSDFHPHGGVAEAYGVLRDGGISERAIFVVDKSGKIAFAKVYDIPTLPDNAEVRQAIAGLGV